MIQGDTMKFLFTISFWFAGNVLFAQVFVQGKVVSEKKEPVPFANVYLKETFDGASTDQQGVFGFETSVSGRQILVVSALGYASSETVVEINKTLIMEIQLQEQINELDAVTISAGSFTASDQSRRTVFRAMDIATTAGVTADIAGALNTLPGTQKVGESGRLFVRGGEGNETRTFIDGLLVMDAYSPAAPNTPSRGRFLPFMFKGTSFSTGGYSSEYGQALSSVLALDSKDESEIARTDIGILSVGGDVAHAQVWSGGSVAGKIHYTNLKPYTGLIDQKIDWKSPPVSMEGMGAFRQQVGESGIVKLYGNFSRSDFAFFNHDINDPNRKELYELSNDFRYLNGSFKNAIGNDWMMRGGVSFTDINNNIEPGEQALKENEHAIHVKSVIEGSFTDKIEVKAGVEVITRDYNYNVSSCGQQNIFDFTETVTAVFEETDFYLSNAFVIRAGIRGEYNSLRDKTTFDPRISFAHKAGEKGQFSLAYGTFSQSPKNEFLRYAVSLKSERAKHLILNYQRISTNRTFRVETYLKHYRDLLKIRDNDFNNEGRGYARGVELFWRDNESVANLDYWISYSFLDTKRDYHDFPYEAVPSFASKHNFSAVAKYFVPKMQSQLGATWSWTSPRTYNNPNETSFNNAKTPAYSDLSFNWSYLPKPYLIVYFTCTNVLGRDNIFGYEYSTVLNEQAQYARRPVRQPAPRFVFLGIFITLSKDKTVNQLPVL